MAMKPDLNVALSVSDISTSLAYLLHITIKKPFYAIAIFQPAYSHKYCQ